MALARFKDLCMDAADTTRLGEFWAAVLDRSWELDDEGDYGEVASKKAVMGALRLYLDFINLFMMLLQLMGARRD